MGVSSDGIANPIIGPPEITLPISSYVPSQKSKRSENNTPIRAFTFLGFLTIFPLTVMTLSMRGFLYLTAS